MSFPRWFPVSSYVYDPAIQPTKQYQNLQANDATEKVSPKGRYDTTYRREYLNFSKNSIRSEINNPSTTPQNMFRPNNRSLSTGSFDWYYDRNEASTNNNNDSAVGMRKPFNKFDILPPIQRVVSKQSNRGGDTLRDTPNLLSHNFEVSRNELQPNKQPETPPRQLFSRQYQQLRPPTPKKIETPRHYENINAYLPKQQSYQPPTPRNPTPASYDMRQQQQQQPEQQYQQQVQPYSLPSQMPPLKQPISDDPTMDDSFLPNEPIQLPQSEEQSLIEDIKRELGGYTLESLKDFFRVMLEYDINGSSFIHHSQITMSAQRCQLPLNNSILRFLMCKFVSPHQHGYVNYEELLKYLAKCVEPEPPAVAPRRNIASRSNSISSYANQNREQVNNPPIDTGIYDPDESTLLRLMYENMREWDKQVDLENINRQFTAMDYMNNSTLAQKQIEDVLYANRIPIQRSLVQQILEKYCKASATQYKWKNFVNFLQKAQKVQPRSPRKNPQNQPILGYQNQSYSRPYSIEPQQQPQQILRNSLKKDNAWFTRFMNLANAMYKHRVDFSGSFFTLPKEETGRLVRAYNTVYQLDIPDNVIEDALNKTTRKELVLIDDLLKVLAEIN